jgi:hypothetical protein
MRAVPGEQQGTARESVGLPTPPIVGIAHRVPSPRPGLCKWELIGQLAIDLPSGSRGNRRSTIQSDRTGLWNRIPEAERWKNLQCTMIHNAIGAENSLLAKDQIFEASLIKQGIRPRAGYRRGIYRIC